MRITGLTHRLVRLAIAGVTLAVTATTAVIAQQATYDVVSSFGLTFGAGRAPSSLRHNSDGTFYGTTSLGGMFDKGVLFRMDATGAVTPLHSFSGPTDGARPFGMVRTADGRFYGMTSQEGAFGFGTVFSFTLGGGVTTLHSFSTSESSPVDLSAASDGNVYGLTAFGGNFDNGTIFVIDPAGSFRTILSIPLTAGTNMTSLVKASDGRFYVAARTGGVGAGAGFGTVFAIDGAGTVTNLHNFTGLSQGDGEGPVGLMQRRDGRVYGTTRVGGASFAGTVYSIDPDGAYRVVHSFNSMVDGQGPEPDLLEGSDGHLYGVTQAVAKLFRIDSGGTLTTLHDLSGLLPGELIEGMDGRLYGPTAAGGSGGGTIITRDVAGTLTTLYEFGTVDGLGRPASVIQTGDGRFYGTTSVATRPFPDPPYVVQESPIGTVFAMDAAGTRTTLHTFFATLPFRNDGSPIGHLFEGADGGVYGTTYTFAEFELPQGQIFRIGPEGFFTRLASSWSLRAGVIQARDGRLYGVTGDPSARNVGVVFRVEANGTRTTLHSFGTDTAYPIGELVEIDDGSLYGATEGGTVFPFPPGSGPLFQVPGTIFQVNPATGAFATRHSFTDGSTPAGRLIQGTDGLLYGTTVNGGPFGVGTVFSLDAAGTLTTLHHFSRADGANPIAGVIQGTDGRLYGTTTNGGAFGYGTVFVMNVTGGLTTLHDFALSDGANPVSELFQANDGGFYGAAPAGGPKDGGVIFRVRLDTSPADVYYELVSRNSGKCLDVYGASTDAAASVIQWVCHGGENQQWRLEPAGGGAVRIIARHSGQVLDVYGALLDDVIPIIQWPAHGGDNQAWTLQPASDGYVSIVARHSGKALDVELASIDDGARVIQFTPHGGANQQWLLRRLEATASSSTP